MLKLHVTDDLMKVLEFLHMVGVADDRQAVIVGSSFGGLLAVNVAHQVWYVPAWHWVYYTIADRGGEMMLSTT